METMSEMISRRFFGHLPLIIMVATASAGLQAFHSHAFADEPKAYTVANYPVEAQAKNAVLAKKMAIKEGQQAAFRSLLKRIVPVSVYSRLDRVKKANAGDYISGISVRSERNSSTEYIANLDFIFNVDATRQLLRQEGVPFIDEAAAVTTVVPVFRAGNGQPLKLGLGAWGKTWRGLDLANTITPVRIVGLKPTVSADTLASLEAGDAGAVRNVSGEYGTGAIVFAFAQRDEKARRLHVKLVGRDGTGRISLNRTYPLADNDVPYAMEYAAVISLGIFEGRWKATRARSRGGIDVLTGPAVPLVLRVQFNNPGQWYKLQDRLRSIEGVGDLQVAAVSARSADVALTFPGGGAQLANVLARQGISLRDAGGVWVMQTQY